jgi:hypothetical protein
VHRVAATPSQPPIETRTTPHIQSVKPPQCTATLYFRRWHQAILGPVSQGGVQKNVRVLCNTEGGFTQSVRGQCDWLGIKCWGAAVTQSRDARSPSSSSSPFLTQGNTGTRIENYVKGTPRHTHIRVYAKGRALQHICSTRRGAVGRCNCCSDRCGGVA